MSRVSDAPLGSQTDKGGTIGKQWETWAAQVADSLSVGNWGRSFALSVPGVVNYKSVVQHGGSIQVFVKWDTYAAGTFNLNIKASGILTLANTMGSSFTNVLIVDGIGTLPVGSYGFINGSLAQILEV